MSSPVSEVVGGQEVSQEVSDHVKEAQGVGQQGGSGAHLGAGAGPAPPDGGAHQGEGVGEVGAGQPAAGS